MPTYEVQMNGQTYEIDAPDDQSVQLAVKQLHGQDQPSTGSKIESNLNASASGFANGIPIVGPALNAGLDRAEAGIRSLWNGDGYQQELQNVQGKESADIAANPGTHTLAGVAGGVYGTLPAALAAPAAFGAGTGSLLARAGISGLTGASIGGADSAVRSEGDVGSTLAGAGIGLAGGAMGPALGKAIGAGIRYAQGSADDALSSLSRPTQNYVEAQFADPAKVAAQQAQLQTLGPQATLADVSPSWLGVARGAATQPSMRDQIVNALVDRAQGAPARLRSDADQFLGPRVIPSQIETGLADGRNQFAQLYAPVMADAQAVNTQPLAESLDAASANLRGPARAANQQVRGYLNIPDVRVDGQPVLDPNPQALHATREAIDGLLTDETNPNVVRQLTDARNQVDETLAAAAPGIKAADGRMHELFRQSEGLQQGRPILSNEAGALRPEEVQDMMTAGPIPQGEMVGPSGAAQRMRDSVRGEFDRIVGTKANDATALKNTVRGEGDWNRDKLAYMYGPDNSKGILDAVDREVAFNDTTNRVTRGSDTAMGSQFGKFLTDTSKAGNVPADTTLTGIGVKSAKKIAEVLLNRNAQATAQRYASEIGGLSVAQGTSRDAIVEALLNRSQSIAAASDPRLQALITSLTESTGRQLSR